ncbi:MAG TPA: alpha-L-arabinofuranosidase C-terminal domain-containing protein, partial [Isosphaeraceae bacterium]|nr:alpha-L-arabinofuranosidase C-terminal domain-containing protein [Isosphaeraceae bacterium]
KDVAEALLDEGISILRYGGSMINHPEYRWKKMIGPRARRPPMAGTWYPYASNGWGIFDFLNFCEAAGFPGIPALNMDETPKDMADLVEYVNGPSDSEWGRKRVSDGHSDPYRLQYVELGNEEAVDDAYFEKFQPIAEAMWSKDPEMILIVGDFAYGKLIEDPYHFEGGARVNSLAAHKRILDLAKAHDREVWFDIHVSTDHPPQPNGMKPERSYIEQLRKLAPDARFKVVVFEYNAGNHSQRRALSNALATNEVERIGDLLPIACSANCLQPDGQNDNGWDQGLLFLNPSNVWLQPPGYVLQMTRRSYQPLLVGCEVSGDTDRLSVNAKRSEDGKALVLQVVNSDSEPLRAKIEVNGFMPSQPLAQAEELAGPPEAHNTAQEPNRILPKRSEWRHQWRDQGTHYTFPPSSFTILRFE